MPISLAYTSGEEVANFLVNDFFLLSLRVEEGGEGRHPVEWTSHGDG
jgi:hypothetical protein